MWRSSIRPWALSLIAAGLSWGLAQAEAPKGQRVEDPLKRPSVMSRHASAALLTAVDRAGARLVAVGERGTVLTSDDNGKTWTQRPTPVSVMLTNVRFRTDGRGWAVGHSGVVLSTQDGGLTWAKRLDGVQLAQMVLTAAKARVAAGGSPEEVEAAKRAEQSAELLVQDGADKPLLDILLGDERSVLVIGAFGLALRSSDDGASWTDWQGHIPNVNGNHLYGSRRIGEAVYLVGEQGVVFKSTDREQTFQALTLPYKGSLFGVSEVGDGQVLVFGLRGNAYLSRDGGSQWQAVPLPTGASVTGGLKAQDGSVVLVTQAGQVLRSTDAGQSFKSLEVRLPVPFVGVTQAADGAAVMASARGAVRVPLNASGKNP